MNVLKALKYPSAKHFMRNIVKQLTNYQCHETTAPICSHYLRRLT